MIYKYGIGQWQKSMHAYQFSEFGGIKFVNSYFKSRELLMKRLNYANNDFLDVIKRHTNLEVAKNNENKAKKMLISLLLEKGNRKHLEILIKKYEISRKIYSSYDRNFKKKSEDHKNLLNYALLSLCLLTEYKKGRDLRHLNTCLKINDMLCSKVDILKKDEAALVKHAIAMELDEIKKTYKKKGVNL